MLSSISAVQSILVALACLFGHPVDNDAKAERGQRLHRLLDPRGVGMMLRVGQQANCAMSHAKSF